MAGGRNPGEESIYNARRRLQSTGSTDDDDNKRQVINSLDVINVEMKIKKTFANDG